MPVEKSKASVTYVPERDYRSGKYVPSEDERVLSVPIEEYKAAVCRVCELTRVGKDMQVSNGRDIPLRQNGSQVYLCIRYGRESPRVAPAAIKIESSTNSPEESIMKTAGRLGLPTEGLLSRLN